MDEIELMGEIFIARQRRATQRLRLFGITLPQLRLIQLARRRGAISPSAAAAELFCDRPTATLIAQKCVSQGWLVRRRFDADRRSARLALSGEGEELLDRIEKSKMLSSAILGDPLDVLGTEERLAFREALAKIEKRSRELFEDRGGHPPP